MAPPKSEERNQMNKSEAFKAAKAARALGKNVKVFKRERIYTVPFRGITVQVEYFIEAV